MVGIGKSQSNGKFIIFLLHTGIKFCWEISFKSNKP